MDNDLGISQALLILMLTMKIAMGFTKWIAGIVATLYVAESL